MTIRVTRGEEQTFQVEPTLVHLSRVTQLTRQEEPQSARLGRCEMLVWRSLEDGGAGTPPPPPAEPPPTPEPPPIAPILRRSDITKVLNEFGSAMVDTLELYADEASDGFTLRQAALDMNGFRILNVGAATAPFDLLSVNEASA